MTTVIKAGQAGPILQRLSTVDLADHLAAADQVVLAAKREAEQIVARAQTKADEMNTDAHLRGFDEGYAQGLADGRKDGSKQGFDESLRRFAQEQESLIADLSRLVEEFERIKKDIAIRAEQDLLAFAVRLATKMTFAIGCLHREAAQENFRRALRLIGSSSDLVVHVHPKDVESLQQFAPQILETMRSSAVVHVTEDATINPGGCRVQSEQTHVDATLDTQLEELAGLLVGTSSEDEPQTESDDG